MELCNIKSISLFRELSEESLLSFSKIIEERTYKEGEIIFNAGDEGDSLYIISKGKVDVFITTDRISRKEKILATFENDDFFGEMALLDGRPRSATARSREDSCIFRIKRKEFNEMLEKDSVVASTLLFAIIKIISNRLRQTNVELVTIYETGKIIGSTSELKKMTESILGKTAEACESASGLIAVFNDFTGELEVSAVRGFLEIDFRRIVIEKDKGIIGKAFLSGDSVVTEDFLSNAKYADWTKAGIERDIMLCVPLKTTEKTAGVIFLTDKMRNEKYTNNNVNLVSAVASQAANAIENAKAREESKDKEKLQRVYVKF